MPGMGWGGEPWGERDLQPQRLPEGRVSHGGASPVVHSHPFLSPLLDTLRLLSWKHAGLWLSS